MAVTGYCNVPQLRAFFEEARDTVNSEVIRINYDTPGFWRDFMPRGEFRLGKGYVQQNKYYEPSYVEAHTKWRSVKDAIDAGEGCDLAPEMIDYGSSFTNFEMERIEARGPNVCLLELLDLQDFMDELARQYQELARVGQFKLENRYRDAHILFSGMKYLAVPDGKGGLPGYANTFPSAAAGSVALPHQTMLDWIAAELDAEGGWQANMGIQDGAPLYYCVCSNDTTEQILRSDGAARDDIRRSSMADELTKRWHASLSYKRFLHINDVQAARFTFDATNGFTRVPYFRKAVASIGYKAEPNPAYKTAPYELILVIGNRLGPQALDMPQVSTPGGNTNFSPVHRKFAFEFINYGDNVNNPFRNHGYFMGDAMEAIDPRQSRFIKAIMVARNVDSIEFATPSAPAGSVPAAIGLNLFRDVDQCGLLAVEACSNAQPFTCADTGASAPFANSITISPIRDGAVSVSDTVKIEGAGDTVFTVQTISSTGGLTNNSVKLGYDGAAIDCAALVKDWRLYDSATGIDVEDDPAS